MTDYTPIRNDYEIPKPLSLTNRYVSLEPQVDQIALNMNYDPHNALTVSRATHHHHVRSRSVDDESTSMIMDDGLNMSRIHQIFFVGVIIVSHLMTHISFSQVLFALRFISSSFIAPHRGELAWFLASYTLGVSTFILISIRLGEILGHKLVFTIGYFWFGFWSTLAGFAAYPGNQIFFDFCRAMQGIGPALLLPSGLTLLTRAYPPGTTKNFIVSTIFVTAAPIGFVVGGATGGLIAGLVFWPWAFWIFAIFCFILGVLALVVIPKSLSARSLSSYFQSFDVIGAVLCVSSFVLVNVAWNNSTLYGWSTPNVYFLLIIGLLLLAAFIAVEMRQKTPILPISALDFTVAIVIGCVALGWGSFSIWAFYTVRFITILRESLRGPVFVQFIPAIFTGILAAGLSVLLLKRTPVSFVLLVGMLAFLISNVVAGTMPVNEGFWGHAFFSVIFMPFGMTLSLRASTLILSNHMSKEFQALAQSLPYAALTYCMSIAFGMAGTVELDVLGGVQAINNAGAEDLEKAFHSSFYMAISMDIAGVVLGTFFFIRVLMKEGWRVTKL